MFWRVPLGLIKQTFGLIHVQYLKPNRFDSHWHHVLMLFFFPLYKSRLETRFLPCAAILFSHPVSKSLVEDAESVMCVQFESLSKQTHRDGRPNLHADGRRYSKPTHSLTVDSKIPCHRWFGPCDEVACV